MVLGSPVNLLRSTHNRNKYRIYGKRARYEVTDGRNQRRLLLWILSNRAPLLPPPPSAPLPSLLPTALFSSPSGEMRGRILADDPFTYYFSFSRLASTQSIGNSRQFLFLSASSIQRRRRRRKKNPRNCNNSQHISRQCTSRVLVLEIPNSPAISTIIMHISDLCK